MECADRGDCAYRGRRVEGAVLLKKQVLHGQCIGRCVRRQEKARA